MNYFRKDESCPFYIDEHPHKHITPYIDLGAVSQDQRLSNDELTKTVITRYKTLSDFNIVVNLNTVELRNSLFEFSKANRAPKKSPQETYRLLGIGTPFRLTSIYTFPANSIYQSMFVTNVRSSLITDGRFELHGVELIEQDQTVTVIEPFKDSNEFNAVRFADGYWIPQLHKMQVTKQLSYELI